MDSFQLYHYQVAFERDFLKKKGQAYQDFFCEIMERGYPNDFRRIRPWGKLGDEGNDGYLQSKRMLFQVYSPNAVELKKTLKKIDDDFKKAFPYHQDYFDSWVFVHNGREGLPMDIDRKLRSLAANHNPLHVIQWGFVEIWNEVRRLNGDDIIYLLGFAPSRSDMFNLEYADLKFVLDHIATKPEPWQGDYRAVPPGKLSFNQLSHHVAALLAAGIQGARLVADFFGNWHDVTYGDRIAEAFKQKYTELKASTLSPDEIFTELQIFTGGVTKGPAAHEAAVYAVLAYLFERCDIFERPLRDDFADQTS